MQMHVTTNGAGIHFQKQNWSYRNIDFSSYSDIPMDINFALYGNSCKIIRLWISLIEEFNSLSLLLCK